jgi:integrase
MRGVVDGSLCKGATQRFGRQGLAFADELGGMLDLDSVSKAFAAIAKELGIRAKGISLHSLRHFFASQSITDGIAQSKPGTGG